MGCRKLSRVTGAGLVLIGSLIWTTRLSYGADTALSEKLRNRIHVIPADKSSDISGACLLEDRPEAWIIFILESVLIPDDEFRTYFQTAEEPVGLFVEYDSGLVRLGLGLGTESAESSKELPIRWVRREEQATIVIGVSQQETRVIANGIDERTTWPGEAAAIWRCNSVQIANDSRAVPGGFTCRGCDTRLLFATGTRLSELHTILDTVSNVASLNIRRLLGNSLVILGMILIIFSFRGGKALHHRTNTAGKVEIGGTFWRRVIAKTRK